MIKTELSEKNNLDKKIVKFECGDFMESNTKPPPKKLVVKKAK